jgi:hypothetical protein
MANIKITDLTAATALGGTELFECVQSSSSVKASAQQIKTYVGSSLNITGGVLGSVTISNGVGNFSSLAITTGAIPFNTITNRAIGQFESHVDQTATSANVAYVVQMNNAAGFNSGITIASSTNVTVAATGVYSINASIQFANSDSNDHTSTFWFKKDGTNIPNSASIISVPKVAEGGKTLAQVTIFESMTVSSYVQLVWSASNIAVSLDYSSATATAPEVPSVIFNMQRIK